MPLIFILLAFFTSIKSMDLKSEYVMVTGDMLPPMISIELFKLSASPALSPVSACVAPEVETAGMAPGLVVQPAMATARRRAGIMMIVVIFCFIDDPTLFY